MYTIDIENIIYILELIIITRMNNINDIKSHVYLLFRIKLTSFTNLITH